jgi:hypothetical protein
MKIDASLMKITVSLMEIYVSLMKIAVLLMKIALFSSPVPVGGRKWVDFFSTFFPDFSSGRRVSHASRGVLAWYLTIPEVPVEFWRFSKFSIFR